MKAFDQYLVEAEKEYAFRLRVATDLEEGVMDKIENRLKKYEAFSISTPKKTMFQASPPGFAHLPGAELNIVDFVVIFQIGNKIENVIILEFRNG